MKLAEAISIRVKTLLKQYGWTQYQLFLKSGVQETTISAIVRHVHGDVKIGTLYEITQGFGMPLCEFFKDPVFDEITVD